MEFVSKQQTYDALRKLMLQYAVQLGDGTMDEVARNMEMHDGKSRLPALYERFLDTLTADPLEPQDALASAAEFLEKNVDASGKPATQALIRSALATSEDPQADVALWNRWIEVLGSV